MQLQSFVNFSARWGVGVDGDSHAPATLPAGKETQYSMYRWLGGPQGRSGRVWKISLSPGFDPRTAQSIAQLLVHVNFSVRILTMLLQKRYIYVVRIDMKYKYFYERRSYLCPHHRGVQGEKMYSSTPSQSWHYVKLMVSFGPRPLYSRGEGPP